jgi:pimeloyl-ACP methyl ester carboxylesterase
MSEQPLSFQSNGEELVGILNQPGGLGKAPDLGIVFTHSGSRGRLGNTFHYPYFARCFAAAGIPTLRFDPAGLGDSTGTIETGDIRALYREIQTGCFVGDTLAAIDEFLRHVRPRRLLLFGVCGGAATALLTAQRCPRIDGVVLLSLPVLLDGPDVSTLSDTPSGYAREYLVKNYAKKLLSITAWARLLTARSDMRRIFECAIASVRPSTRTGFVVPRSVEAPPHPRLNRHVLAAMESLTERGSRLLVLLGHEDSLRHHWETELHRIYWPRRPAFSRLIDVHYIPGCNHMFTLREWQQKAVSLSLDWIGKLASCPSDRVEPSPAPRDRATTAPTHADRP